jgi:sensor histidine kinase regulating citrate/malate metabolism
VIVASALDNAIEGIERSGEVERTIKLSVDVKADYILVVVDNHASGPVSEGFRTTKPDGADHGFGLQQMRSIAGKYDGAVTPGFDTKSGRFSLNVLLKNRKA